MSRFSSRRVWLVLAPLTASLVMMGGPVAHAERSQNDAKAREAAAIRQAVARHELQPLPRILRLAQAAVAGDVIKVETEIENGRLIYEIKILAANGRLREVKLDARTAALLQVEDD